MSRALRVSAFRAASTVAFAVVLAACGSHGGSDSPVVDTPRSDGPVSTEAPVVHAVGNATSGQQVFRFETFGNEGFWTDAMRLQQGMMATGMTPLRALQLGLMIDSDALDPTLRATFATEGKTDLSAANAPTLNDPAALVRVVNANALIGIAAKDSSGRGSIDIANGSKTGATCALCHAITDASVVSTSAGTIGKRLDGRANHALDFGTFIATALNTRAYYPVLQLALQANGGKTLGRAPTGLTPTSTEAQVDAYLSNKAYYPVGSFDDTIDGNGDPQHNSALFRTDLAAPWGTEGTIARLDNFSNLVYTALLDPTIVTTPGGRAFVMKLGGAAAGTELADGYVQVLTATGVTGYPYLITTAGAEPGSENAPLGVRVDNTKLIDMNAYLNGLQAPPGVGSNAAATARGRDLFRQSCTACHNVDQSKPVPAFTVPMKTIFPGDNPEVLLAMRTPPLNPILNTAASIYDDKTAVVNASIRGGIRGSVMPLLLDLARKPNYLHDNSVPTLDNLLDPVRGAAAPHPFYFADTAQRADMIEFLRGASTTPSP